TVPERILIRNGRVLDPANGIDTTGDVLLDDDKVVQVGTSLPADGARVIDATGFVVTPGFVDLHTHLREPGFEYKESIETGTLAAAAAPSSTPRPLTSRSSTTARTRSLWAASCTRAGFPPASASRAYRLPAKRTWFRAISPWPG